MNCSSNEVQEDNCENSRNDLNQEECQIQKLLEMDLMQRESMMSVKEFLRNQYEDQNESESEVLSSEVLAAVEDQVSTDQANYTETVDQKKEQIEAGKAIETSKRENDIVVKDPKVKRRGGFMKKLCKLKRLLSSRS